MDETMSVYTLLRVTAAILVVAVVLFPAPISSGLINNNDISLNRNVGPNSHHLIGWSPIEVLSQGCSADNYFSAIDVDHSNVVHVLINEDNDIYYRFKPVNGTWTEKELVTGDTSSSSYPSLAVDINGNIHIAWVENDLICYKMKSFTGQWTTTEIVSTESNEVFPFEPPSLAVDTYGAVHIAWSDTTDYQGCGDDVDIFYKSKSLEGSWADSPTEVVSVGSTESSWCPDLAVDSEGNVHVVWSDSANYQVSDNDRDIIYRMKPQGSALWTPAQVISTESHSSGYEWGSDNSSILVSDEGTVYVLWQDDAIVGYGGESDIFLKSKPAAGCWADAPLECASVMSSYGSCYPSFAVQENGKIHAAWCETWYDGEYRSEIVYVSKSPGGSWGASVMISFQGNPQAWYPFIDVGSDRVVHAVWTDYTNYLDFDGDADIFYRSSLKKISDEN